MTTQTGEALQGFNAPDSTGEVSTETKPETTEQQEPEGEVDWQSKYESEAAAHTKTANDLTGMRTGRQNADDRQAEVINKLTALESEQTRQRRQSEALMTAIASGETEALPQKVGEINQEHETRQASDSLVTQANNLHNQIIDAVVPVANGDREAAIRMINTQPEFQTIRDGWTQHSRDSIDLVGLSGVVAQTAGVVVNLGSQKAAESVRQAETTAAKKLEEADVLNLDVGGGASAADISDTARNIKLADSEYTWTDDDREWYGKYRKTQGFR